LAHLYIFSTIFFTVTSQLIIKWRMSTTHINLPEDVLEKILFLLKALLDPFILTSILLTLFSGLSWMAAMTKFELSYAYPFIGLTFIMQLFFSYYLFNESLSIYKLIGVGFIALGILISSQSPQTGV